MWLPARHPLATTSEWHQSCAALGTRACELVHRFGPGDDAGERSKPLREASLDQGRSEATGQLRSGGLTRGQNVKDEALNGPKRPRGELNSRELMSFFSWRPLKGALLALRRFPHLEALCCELEVDT